jgi:hypothetical protein
MLTAYVSCVSRLAGKHLDLLELELWHGGVDCVHRQSRPICHGRYPGQVYCSTLCLLSRSSQPLRCCSDQASQTWPRLPAKPLSFLCANSKVCKRHAAADFSQVSERRTLPNLVWVQVLVVALSFYLPVLTYLIALSHIRPLGIASRAC